MASRDLLGVVTSYSSLRPPARPCGGPGRGPGPRQPRYKLVSIIPRLGAARPPVGGGKPVPPKRVAARSQGRTRYALHQPMSNAPAPSRSPLVLLVNAHEWSSRAFESILGPAGYAVLKAYSGREALAGAHRVRLDAVVLDTELPDVDAFTLCRALRVDPDITASTPIFLTTPGPTLRTELLEGLRAGANGLWGQPLDTEHFLLRLEGHLRAKLDADRAGPREFAVLAPQTSAAGAVGLGERLARAVGDLTRAAGEPPLRLRAGYETALGVRRGSAQPTEVVVRALAALRASEADPRGS